MHKNVSLKFYLDLQNARDDDVTLTIKPTADEYIELAKRLKIPEVTSLQADVEIKQGLRADLYEVSGQLKAKVIQECGVTLAPVHEAIDEYFNELMTTSEVALKAPEEVDDDAPVELLENDRIDLNEVVSQWLGLALDPYPRSADAPPFEHIEAEGDPTHTPFDVLSRLKGK